MSTAQGDWDDQHRNHELAPKQADTAEPMSVAERCDIIWHHMRHSGGQGQQALFDLIAEQIRQAEQAARTHERRQVNEDWIVWLNDLGFETAERGLGAMLEMSEARAKAIRALSTESETA